MKTIHLTDRVHKALRLRSLEEDSKAVQLLNMILEDELVRSGHLPLVEPIDEMANIGPKSHRFGVDVKLHLLQPGTRKLSHGPRVKVFRGTDEFVITLNTDPDKMRIIGTSFLNSQETKRVFRNVVKFRSAFLQFWNDPKMDTDELHDLMDDLR